MKDNLDILPALSVLSNQYFSTVSIWKKGEGVDRSILESLSFVGNLMNHLNLGKFVRLEEAEIRLQPRVDDWNNVFQVLCSLREAKAVILMEQLIKTSRFNTEFWKQDPAFFNELKDFTIELWEGSNGIELARSDTIHPSSSVVANTTPMGKVRRIAIYLDESVDKLIPSKVERGDYLRSLLYFGPSDDWFPTSKELISTMTIPDVIWKMKQLRHLYLPWYYKASGKLQLSALCNLQTLYSVSSSSCDLNDLAGISSLRKLRIILSSPFNYMENLLETAGSTLNFESNGCPEQVTQIVAMCRQLYKLTLIGPTLELPKELQYTSLTKVLLSQCCLKDDQMAILEKLQNLTTLTSEEKFLGRIQRYWFSPKEPIDSSSRWVEISHCPQRNNY
ncbi:hypothetical protein ACLB2K_065843 [Fragaria x ananassa]